MELKMLNRSFHPRRKEIYELINRLIINNKFSKLD